MRFIRFALPAMACAALAPASAAAHGFAGERFFPATLLTDDPFVADEMSLPTLTINPTGADGSKEIDLGVDLAKRLWPDVGISISDQWQHLKPKGAPSASGLGTLRTELDWQFFTNAPHEATAMAGLSSSWAHTGRVQALGADDFTTLSPLVDFGKGFGDLPDSLKWVRPFAVTGNFSVDFPTKTESAGNPNPNNFNYGFAFEYSLPYLQQNVKDIGLGEPFKSMIPLVEVSYSTALNRGQGGQTIGTVQPGVIWSGQYFQIGAEAIIPATRQTGNGYGAIVQFHLYLDDIFPNSFGRPLFGD
ncbi:MAG TPA: hypothetical protein VG308_13870 [Stellaceae bacterium]|jgi:hypothetical protein|nr:hypothetical protein [Stellaceae bacterium]